MVSSRFACFSRRVVVRLCYGLKTRAIRCTAGIPDTASGTRRRRRSLRVLIGVRGDTYATERSSPRTFARLSSTPGSTTRSAFVVYIDRDGHASSPNSSWKSLRLWMMSPASARCASLEPTALRLGTRQFLLFMYSCESSRARRAVSARDDAVGRKRRNKVGNDPRHARRVGEKGVGEGVPRRSPRALTREVSDAPRTRR